MLAARVCARLQAHARPDGLMAFIGRVVLWISAIYTMLWLLYFGWRVWMDSL
jgi:hypothetical protein